MSKIQHIFFMVTGFVLYLIIIRLILFGSVIKGGIWFWALPFIGYYAYHPKDLKWHEPVPEFNHGRSCDVADKHNSSAN